MNELNTDTLGVPPSAMNIRLIKCLVGVGESYKPSSATVTGPTPNKGQWGSRFFRYYNRTPLPTHPRKKKKQPINKVVIVFFLEGWNFFPTTLGTNS